MNAYSGFSIALLSLRRLQFQFIGNLPFIAMLSIVVAHCACHSLAARQSRGGHSSYPCNAFQSLPLHRSRAGYECFSSRRCTTSLLHGLRLIDRFPAGPFAIPLSYVSGVLSSLSLAIIMLLRSSTMSRRQAIIETELAAAKEVQNVLLPEHREIVPGFTVDSVYEPAQQVGDDFFQILPAGDGGLVIVVGDVAGKGLPAAMRVSVLVGRYLRFERIHKGPSRVALRDSMSDSLAAPMGGFSTALAAHITANGAVTIANAGHLSPYLDGKEIELPGALRWASQLECATNLPNSASSPVVVSLSIPMEWSKPEPEG